MGSISFYPFLICCISLLDVGASMHLGQEFLTVFLQNGYNIFENSVFNLTITAFNDETSVTITVANSKDNWSLLLNNGESKTISLPHDIELLGSGVFNSSILITSDKDITARSISSKDTSSPQITLYPVDLLGHEYYIVTPNVNPRDHFKEFAVACYHLPTSVKIFIKSWLNYKGVNYTSNVPLTLNLQPGQVIQLQSIEDLSGTRVLSKQPVAVFSGNSCIWKNNYCNHVFEQLLPVSFWGKEYIVSPLPFQYRSDMAYITASKDTIINYISGSIQETHLLTAGQMITFSILLSWPLSIWASEPVQVMFYCIGGIAQGMFFHPFLISVPDTSKFCTSYQVYGLQGFINAVLITAKTASIHEIVFNRQRLEGIQWRKINGTEYSWTQYRYGRQSRLHFVRSSGTPFSAISLGLSPERSYGMSAVCTLRYQNCRNIRCRTKESCYIYNGIPTCVPDSEAVCQVHGNLHYYTFDGHSFDFHGTCTYLVAKSCSGPTGLVGDPTLPEFNIEAKNENQGNLGTLSIAAVYVQILGYNITLMRSEVGFVRVDNIKWPLPISLDMGGILITQTGFYALLETDYIRIRYDWGTFLFIKIPSSFFENVCGLCGNYNGDSSDDFHTSTGLQADGTAELGKSWKVKNNEYCWDNCYGKCETVLLDAGSLYRDPKSCGIISQVHGPFHQCHLIIDETHFLKDCVYDLITNDGYKQILCRMLTIYTMVCQIYGIHVDKWRKSLGCEISCPENSRYNVCGSSCPTTCAGTPPRCLRPCVETCECEPGFVLSEGKCLPQTSCGCFFKGRHYPLDYVFWMDSYCTEKCMCNPDSGKVYCWKTSCRAGEECKIENGVRDCYPTSYSTCAAYGDPHYITFDGFQYNFQGACKYHLSGLCELNNTLPEFHVYVINWKRSARNVSHTRSVSIEIDGIEILINREIPGKVLINGISINLPYTFETDEIRIFKQGWDAVVLTKFGLKVTFDWLSRVTVTLPVSYSGAVCGLCGNYNNNPSDDLLMRNSQLAPHILEFGKSWQTKETSVACGEVEPSPPLLLKDMEDEQRQNLSECGIILNKEGPFRDCHRVVKPDKFFKDCVFDSYFYEGRHDIFCQVIAAYAAACQESRGTVYSWRTEHFCKPWCPENSTYKLCASDCALTCSSLNTRLECPQTCKEGCVCNDGFTYNVDKCVPLNKCGCTYNELYYKLNDIFYPTNNCDKKCECQPGGSVYCVPHVCSKHETCTIWHGERKCHPTGSALCSAMGDPHYRTFDGFTYDFHGNCSYILAKSCLPGTTALVPFTVTVKNSDLENSPVSVTKTVTISAHDVQISLLQGMSGIVKVNGLYFHLPLNLLDKGIWVYQHGLKVAVRAFFGIQVTYDLAYTVDVRVSSSYSGQMCGLCGNYNDNNKDDFQLPDGLLTDDLIAFGKSWQVDKDNPCSSGCGGPKNSCPQCDDNSLYQHRNSCGLLTDPEGPFSGCQGLVDPTMYFNNCVFDMCQRMGHTDILCTSLQSYASACQNAGIKQLRWRSQNLCPLSCSANSHYEVCADTCSNTCAGVVSRIICSKNCSEGCQCDNGFYLDGNRCVSLSNCGCVVNGLYYQVNESFLKSRCTELCTCHEKGVVTCDLYNCRDPNTCKTLLDGSYMCN